MVARSTDSSGIPSVTRTIMRSVVVSVHPTVLLAGPTLGPVVLSRVMDVESEQFRLNVQRVRRIRLVSAMKSAKKTILELDPSAGVTVLPG